MFDSWLKKRILSDATKELSIVTHTPADEAEVDAELGEAFYDAIGGKKISEKLKARIKARRDGWLGELAVLDQKEAKNLEHWAKVIHDQEAVVLELQAKYNAACKELWYSRAQARGEGMGLQSERGDLMRKLEKVAPPELQAISEDLKSRWQMRAEQNLSTPMLDMAAERQRSSDFLAITGKIMNLRYAAVEVDKRLAELRTQAEAMLAEAPAILTCHKCKGELLIVEAYGSRSSLCEKCDAAAFREWKSFQDHGANVRAEETARMLGHY